MPQKFPWVHILCLSLHHIIEHQAIHAQVLSCIFSEIVHIYTYLSCFINTKLQKKVETQNIPTLFLVKELKKSSFMLPASFC